MSHEALNAIGQTNLPNRQKIDRKREQRFSTNVAFFVKMQQVVVVIDVNAFAAIGKWLINMQ